MSEPLFEAKGLSLVTMYVREAGPHKRVQDRWTLKEPVEHTEYESFPPRDMVLRGLVLCVCLDCDADWPEGGMYPEKCK